MFDFGTIWNGVEIAVGDLPHDVRGWIMWRLACMAATHCGDKAAALEALGHEADEILKLASGDRTSQYLSPNQRGS